MGFKSKSTKIVNVEQNEKAFQKQDAIFLGSKRVLAGKVRKGELRYWKNVGLGIKTPQDAVLGTYVDKKCPFTGNVSIRGRVLRGVVSSAKMRRSVSVRRDYLHYIRKYNRFEKRHRNLLAHCAPCFTVKEGDMVTVGQCRPLSKCIRFNVVKVVPQVMALRKKRFQPL